MEATQQDLITGLYEFLEGFTTTRLIGQLKMCQYEIENDLITPYEQATHAQVMKEIRAVLRSRS